MDTSTKIKTPLTKVDGDLAQKFDWGSIQWLVSDKQFAGCELTLGHVEIKAGEKNVLHTHPNCDEALWLIEGELLHSVGDQKFEMRPGMSIFIPKNVRHDAINTGKTTARMIVAYSSGDRQTIMHEEGDEG